MQTDAGGAEPSNPLGTRVRGAILATLIGKQFQLLIGGGALLVLARLLDPADYGLFGLLFSVYAVAEVAATYGLKAFLVRADTLEEDDWRSALGLGLTLSFGLAALLALLAALAPTEARATGWLLAAAVAPFGLAVVAETRRERELEFSLIAKLSVLRGALDAATVIGLAILGFGPAALAAGVLVERWANAAILGLIYSRRHGVGLSFLSWQRFSKLGRQVSLANAIPHLSDMVIAATTSAFLGMPSLGILNRARAVEGLTDRALLNGIKPVILPAFSAALREGTPAGEVYLMKTERLASVCWPIFLVMFVTAEPLIAVLLGPDWRAATDPFRILALGGLIVPFTRMGGKFFIAIGRADAFLRYQIIHHACLMVLSALGALHSIEAVAAAISAAFLIKAILLVRAVKQITDYDVAEFFNALRGAAALSAFCITGPLLLTMFASGLPPLPFLILAMTSAAALGFLGLLILRHPLLGELESFMHFLRPKRGLGSARKTDH
ncbi:MAG: oligosaccharide flippase family protein [Parvularcula sp.]|jgi:O-antigen/teichoic acid export membrane protein|nr:oligosaccharide flippase family protein [Parvularcula sp.]